jgi:hypothetical protein
MQVQKPAAAHLTDAPKLVPSCRVGGSEFKLRLVPSEENNLKVEL